MASESTGVPDDNRYWQIDEYYCPYRKSYVKKFLCEEEAGVVALPECCVGSMAYDIHGKQTYIRDGSGNWVTTPMDMTII